jgi:hypothetical protein
LSCLFCLSCSLHKGDQPRVSPVALFSPSAPQTRKAHSARFLHLILGQKTQNPELITQNFPKGAGGFLLRKGVEVGCLQASLTDLPEQGAGDRVRLAPSPLVAPLPRRSERKPSGIPSVTVVPTVILQSVPAFLVRTPGGDPATTANLAERTHSPERRKGVQPRRIPRSSGQVREA